MKSFKILSLVLMVSLAFGLTSCLNSSNDNSDNTYSGIVEVVNLTGTTYFQTSDGTKIVPTASSLATVESTYKFTATSGLAYIAYTTSTTSSTSSISATLTYAVSLQNATVSAVRGGAEDVTAQLPIISLDALSSGSSSNKIALYNSSTLLIATNLFFSVTSSSSSSTIPTHTLSLVFYPNEVSSGDTEMDLYLRHQSSDTGTAYYTSYYAYTIPYMYYRSYSISSQLSQFENKSGKIPTTITIHYPVNTSNLTLPSDEETSSVTYSK